MNVGGSSERYREIAETLGRHGLSFLSDSFGMSRAVPIRGDSPDPSPRASRHTVPARLRKVLEELGPTFVKLGQLLSTRPDLLPPAYISELSKLQDGAPPIQPGVIREAIRAELGADALHIFSAFDDRPLASASIGQAHGAVLADGTPVVVKVRRPDAVRKVNDDLEILQNLADRAERIWEPARAVGAHGIVQEFAQSLRAELDYLQEARNAETFAANFKGSAEVSIPRVFWDTTTSRVLTMERVSGIRINDVAALDAAGVDRPALAKTGSMIMLRMIFQDGFFHGDPHPGNLFVQPNGSITLIDFGIVGELDPILQARFVDFLVAFTRRQPEELADALIALSVSTGLGDREQLGDDLASFIADYSDKPLSDIRFAHLASTLLGIVRRHRLQLPREVALVFKVLVILEGIGVQLDPDFDLLGVLAPYVRGLLRARMSLAVIAQRVLQASVDTSALMIELPTRLRHILERVDKSGIEVHLRAAELEPLVARTERIGNRLVAGLLAAALINGIGDLVVSEKRWRSWAGVLLGAGVTVGSSLAGYLIWTSKRHRR